MIQLLAHGYMRAGCVGASDYLLVERPQVVLRFFLGGSHFRGWRAGGRGATSEPSCGAEMRGDEGFAENRNGAACDG